MTMIELLEKQGYDTEEYQSFTINEIDAMYSNSQLDMLFKNTTTGRKTYVKYYLTAKQIRPQNLDEIVEDLFVLDNVLTKEDTLIVIIEDEPNETIHTKMKYLYDHDGIFVIIHNMNRLQYNILKHTLVPECDILTDKECEEFMVRYNIKKLSQLPEISRFDPQALAIGLRPNQVCRFKRKSNTAMYYDYYRVCI
jgi:DNA-directed RNA polymerase subunit H (RpoH/RPB5)